MSNIIAWEVSQALVRLRRCLNIIQTNRKWLEGKPLGEEETKKTLGSLKKVFGQASETLSMLDEACSFHLLSSGAVEELKARRSELNALFLWYVQEMNKFRHLGVRVWHDPDRFGKIEPIVEKTRDSTFKEMRRKYRRGIMLKAFELFVMCSAIFAAAGFFS